MFMNRGWQKIWRFSKNTQLRIPPQDFEEIGSWLPFCYQSVTILFLLNFYVMKWLFWTCTVQYRGAQSISGYIYIYIYIYKVCIFMSKYLQPQAW
jgi:hypothetical protein